MKRAFLLTLVFFVGSAFGVTLTSKELGQAGIVVSENADEDVKFAARDFKEQIKQMTGAQLSISSKQPKGYAFIFGRGQETIVLCEKLDNKDPWDGSFWLVVQPKKTIVLGDSPAGTINGIYEILHQWGCRWYFPGQAGSYVPKKDVLELAECAKEIVPSFEGRQGIKAKGYKGSAPKNFDDLERLWALRNRSGGWRWLGSGHSYHHLVPEKKYFESHPEYFALIKGKRTPPNLCTSNDKAVKAAAQGAFNWLENSSRRPIVCVSPPDGAKFWCECEKCQKRYPKGQTNTSDRVVDFANRVAEIVEKKYPEVFISYYIYSDYVQPPEKYKPRDNILGWFTLWGTTGITHHAPLSSDENAKARALYEANAKLYKAMGIYAYYGHYNWCTPFPMQYNIANDFPFWKKHKVRLFYCETHSSWATQWWNYYLMYRFAWDISSDIEQIRDEFYRDFCGNAGKWIRQYDDLIYHAFSSKGRVAAAKGEDCAHYTSDVIAKSRKIMQAAVLAANKQGSHYKERIDFLAAGQKISDLWCSAHHQLKISWNSGNKKGREKALALFTELRDFLKTYGDYEMVSMDKRNYFKRIEEKIEGIGGSLTFGKGRFEYKDHLDGGGKVLFGHALAVENMQPCKYGWSLKPKETGFIEWELLAEDGKFSEVFFVLTGYGAGKAVDAKPPAVEIGVGEYEAYSTVTHNKEPKQRRRGFEYNLTELAKGHNSIKVKVTVKNPLDKEICAIELVKFEGKVE